MTVRWFSSSLVFSAVCSWLLLLGGGWSPSLMPALVAAAAEGSTLQVQQHANNHNPIEIFEINLDMPPKERWNQVVETYKEPLMEILDWLLQQVPPKVLPEVTAAANLAEHFFPQDFREEMQGIAQSMKIPVGYVLLSNLYYELQGCASVVAQHADDGIIWHGRNLDFDIPHLQNITIHVQFTKGGQLVYEGTTYACYIGMPTGMKPGAFSLSINARSDGKSVWDNLAEWIFKGGQAHSFLLREILETAVDYDDALRRLQTTTLIAPSYFIIAGISQGQGAVVSRARDIAVDTWTIDFEDNNHDAQSSINATKSNNNGHDRWFLVQTNDDHWLPADDYRRYYTNEHLLMLATPQTISADSMWDVMTMNPTLNDQTIYTSVMSPGANYFASVIQNVAAKDTNGGSSNNHTTRTAFQLLQNDQSEA